MKENATERKNKLFQLCKYLLNKKNNCNFQDTIAFLKANLADLNIALVIEYIPDDVEYDSVLSFLFEEVLNTQRIEAEQLQVQHHLVNLDFEA